MTVSELIEKLKGLPGDLPIILTGEWEWEATKIEQVFFGYADEDSYGSACFDPLDIPPYAKPAIMIS